MANPEIIESSIEKNLEKKLDKIDEKLSNMLTKDDRSFIRDIIKDTFEEMKEQLLGSITKRVEVLETDVHSKSLSVSKIYFEISATKLELEKKIEHSEERLKNEIKTLKSEKEKLKESANDLEQYSRRNNLRAIGIKGDTPKQASDQTKSQFQKMCQDSLGFVVSDADIDIAHRIGPFKTGSNRPVIVKFVRRQTKIDIMKNVKKLKNTGICLNEDLTHISQQALMSLRLKDPQRIEKAWAFEGKVFATFRSTNPSKPENMTTRQIKFSEFDYWLSLPWPERKKQRYPAQEMHRDPTPTHAPSPTQNPWNRK